MAAPSVTVSLPVPPVMVSTLETVRLLVPLTRVSLSRAAAEIDGAAGERRAKRDRVGAAAAGDGLDGGHGQRCWRRRRTASGVSRAGAQIDGAGCHAPCPAVTVSSPVPPVMVSMLDDGQRVVAGGRQRQRVGAGAEVDACRRSRRCRA